MRTRTLALILALLALAASTLYAVGTIVVTEAMNAPLGMARYTLDWASDASGDVNGTTTTLPIGYLVKVEIFPDAAGTQPTDLYDVQLQDAKDVDLLASAGTNQSIAASEVILFDPPIYIDDSGLELVVSAAGNAKGGIVYVWVRQ